MGRLCPAFDASQNERLGIVLGAARCMKSSLDYRVDGVTAVASDASWESSRAIQTEPD